MSQPNMQPGAYVVLKKEYAKLQHYLGVKENSLQLNSLFQELCNYLITTFQALTSPTILPIPPSAPSPRYHHRSVSCLSKFARNFSTLIRQVADYHIACLNQLRQQNRPEFQVYFEFAQQLNALNAINDQMEASKHQLDTLFKQIKFEFIAYRKSSEDPLKYYNAHHIQQTNQKLKDAIERASCVVVRVRELQGKLVGRMGTVEGLLSRLKCKLVKNKYAVLKQVGQLAHNCRSCHAEISELIKECVLTHKTLFLDAQNNIEQSSQLKEMLNRSTEISIEHPLDQNGRWAIAIKTTLDACCNENEAVERVLSQFEQYFSALWQGYEERKFKMQEIVARLSQFYEPCETPLETLLGMMGLQDELQQRLRTVGGKVGSLGMSLRQHKRSCLKHGEIVLSLIKIKNRRREGLLDTQDGTTRKDLSQLVTQIASATPKDQIIAFYDYWLTAQKEIAHSLQQMARPRSRASTDSMDVSYSQTRNRVQRKRPLREQMWLWRDPFQHMSSNTEEYLSYFQEVRRFAEEMGSRVGEKEGVELQKYECILAGSKKEATISITTSGIAIAAKDVAIRLGWKDVLSIQQITHFFDKGVAVVTSHGKIELLRLSHPVQTVLAAIREAQEKGMMGNVKVQVRQQLILTPEEIQRIEARRQKINGEVPTTDGLKLIVSETLEDVRIDEVYQLVYSDQPFNFYGREEPCFFSYTGKKAGNINWQAEKYDRPGPQFYSQQQDVSFDNCPLFSVRRITYNHPMKPTSIPFMPKQSRNEDQRRIYWLSHHELLYHIKSLTFDVPMADNFEVHLLHRITALPHATRIDIYSEVRFVKQTSFKNIIFNNTDPEIDENMLYFMAEVTKLFRLRKEAAEGAEIPLETEPSVPTLQSPPGEVEKLRVYNRVLLAALLLLVVCELLRVWWM